MSDEYLHYIPLYSQTKLCMQNIHLHWQLIILYKRTWIIRMLLALPWLVATTPTLRSKMLRWTLSVMAKKS
jgi:hypothetical protein